jgi:ribosomal-protein-alanine N-acetyltransferase
MRFLLGTKSREQTRQLIERYRASYATHGLSLWATLLKPHQHFIGRCGLLLSEVEGVVEREVAYALARPYWGLGLATEAACAIRDYGFHTLGFRRLVSIIDCANMASRRIAEKNGMQIEREVLYKGDPCYLYVIER